MYLLKNAQGEAIYTGWAPNLRHQTQLMEQNAEGRFIPLWLLPEKEQPEFLAYRDLDISAAESQLLNFYAAAIRDESPRLNFFATDEA